MVRHFVLGVALLAACCGEVWAQPPGPGDSAKAMAGTWEFTNADRDKTCTITLRLEPVAGGMRAEFDKACAAKFPFIGEIAAWTFVENDFLRLVDAKGASVLEFNEVESGVYEAPRPGEGILFIQNAGAAGPPSRTAAEVTGEWSIVRGAGKPICGLTLSNTAAGDGLRGPDAAAMRCVRHPVRAGDLAGRARRTGAQAVEGQPLALRGAGRDHLAARSRDRRSGPAGS